MARQIDGAPIARCALIAVVFAAAFAEVGRAQGAPPTPAANLVVTQELPWPRTVHSGGTTLTIYQPQVDSWDGFALLARCAVRVGAGRTYGTVTIDARTLTDKSTRVVVIDRATVTHANFPDASAAESKRWSEAIVRDLTTPSHFISLDRLEAALAATSIALATELPPIDTTPPRILFSSVPAILVYVDGEPVYRRVAETRLQRVINTRPLVVRDSVANIYYLKIFDGWMEASSLDGAWRISSNPPPELETALTIARQSRLVDELTGRVIPADRGPSLAGRAPVIHVATTPTELIVTEGAANFTPVPGVKVFYMLNTTGRVLKSGQDFNTYVLVAGRWFRAPSLRGPWTYVSSKALPSDFSRIPDSSPIENVKASIAGTRQARDAAVAATIAQTTAVRIFGLHLTPPRFAGEPELKLIEGTQLEYVTNSATPIVRVEGKAVYAVENGVWFTASSLSGPWIVATSVPNEIYSIPATSPLYYVTFARVYATTPEVVYVGYTPGYHGTYIDPSTEVVVYGTGYTYQPWTTTEWFGGPVTYGFGGNLAFTPWTGWTVALGLGLAWSDAVVAGSWGLGAYPWWGPWGWGWAYGPSVYPWKPDWGVAAAKDDVVVWAPGGWAAYSDFYRRFGERATVARVASWTANPWTRLVGLSYNSRTGIATTGQRGAVENILEVNSVVRARDVRVTTEGRLVAASGIRKGDRIHYIVGEKERIREVAAVAPERHESSAAGNVAPSELFAGRDGKVYRLSEGRWEQFTENGWRAAPPDKLPELRRDNAMRDLGDQLAANLRQSVLLIPCTTKGRDIECR